MGTCHMNWQKVCQLVNRVIIVRRNNIFREVIVSTCYESSETEQSQNSNYRKVPAGNVQTGPANYITQQGLTEVRPMTIQQYRKEKGDKAKSEQASGKNKDISGATDLF